MQSYQAERGQSAALIATMMVPILMALVLVCDAGLVFQARRWTQSVADLAALSGGQSLDRLVFDSGNQVRLFDAAQTALASCATHNELNAGLAPTVTCVATEDVNARTVTVSASTTVNTYLLQLFLGAGNSSLIVTSTADAEFVFGIEDEMDQ